MIRTAALTLALATVAAFPAVADETLMLSHNGSIMEMRVDYMNEFKIIYSQPRAGLLTAGVKPGAVLIQGSLRKGGVLVANAAAFKQNCPPLYYPVTGRIEAGAELVLSGPGPVRGERCTMTKLSMESGHSTLKFSRADGSMFIAGVLNPPLAPAAPVAQAEPIPALTGAEMAAAAKGGAQAPQANAAPVAVPSPVAQPAPVIEAKAEPQARPFEPAMPVGPVPSIEKKPETLAPVAATRPVERSETPAPASIAVQSKAAASATQAAVQPAPVPSPIPQETVPQVEPVKPVRKTVDADL